MCLRCSRPAGWPTSHAPEGARQRLTRRTRLSPRGLSAYCARLRADLLSEPINFRFHGKTALHLVHASVALFQRLVDVPLTEHLRKCAAVVGRAEVARLMATEQATFIGAEHGLARVVHQLEADDAIVNKAGLIEKLAAQIDTLRAFHAAFDLLLNAVIDGLRRQAPTRLCVALFTECVLPLFWRTRSPELKQLFFLSARHIDMTATFLFHAELVAALPAEVRAGAFAALFRVVRTAPMGAINHKTAYLTAIGRPAYRALVDLMVEENWANATDPLPPRRAVETNADVVAALTNVASVDLDERFYRALHAYPLTAFAVERLAHATALQANYAAFARTVADPPPKAFPALYDFFAALLPPPHRPPPPAFDVATFHAELDDVADALVFHVCATQPAHTPLHVLLATLRWLADTALPLLVGPEPAHSAGAGIAFGADLPEVAAYLNAIAPPAVVVRFAQKHARQTLRLFAENAAHVTSRRFVDAFLRHDASAASVTVALNAALFTRQNVRWGAPSTPNAITFASSYTEVVDFDPLARFVKELRRYFRDDALVLVDLLHGSDVALVARPSSRLGQLVAAGDASSDLDGFVTADNLSSLGDVRFVIRLLGGELVKDVL